MIKNLCASCVFKPEWKEVSPSIKKGACNMDGRALMLTGTAPLDNVTTEENGRTLSTCGYYTVNNRMVTVKELADATGRATSTVRKHIASIPGAEKDAWGYWSVPLATGRSYLFDIKPGRPTRGEGEE